MVNESKLDDTWFIGGGDNPFEFEVNENGSPVVLKGATITFTLSYVGQKDYPVIIKTMNSGITVTGINTCIVKLSAEDTKYLESSIYEQELTIVQEDGRVLRPSYGYVHIRQGSVY